MIGYNIHDGVVVAFSTTFIDDVIIPDKDGVSSLCTE